MRIETRPKRPSSLDERRLPPFLRDALAARGVADEAGLDLALGGLLPPDRLPGIDQAAERLARAVENDERILIVGDFDADGATASALCVAVLRAFGAQDVDFLVPNRFDFGYGLSVPLAYVAIRRSPDVIVTVDNGVASIDGVAEAQAAGVDVVVTDHHLPGEQLPDACAIVNPNLHGSTFESANLAGVGVAYYVLSALRGRLRASGHFKRRGIAEPRLSDWLDLVAVGTVADLVPLDRNNRILVHQGLRRMRADRTRPGLRALVQVAGRALSTLQASDIGFAVAPRLNAAGRLRDMRLGIECLLEEDPLRAESHAQELDQLNATRREVERVMNEDAVEQATADLDTVDGTTVCVYRSGWHQGVVGIVAGRLRERFHRPAIAFADAGKASPGELRGSARSIPGLHIRDAIADCDSRYPGLVVKFGGHAMAAGLTIKSAFLTKFRNAFEEIVAGRIDERHLADIAVTDGALGSAELRVDNAYLVAEHGPWGQGFEEPSFHGEFDIVAQRVVGERHLRLSLRHDGRVVDAIAFNQAPVDADRARVVYRLGVNDYRDVPTLQLEVDRLAGC